MHDPILLLLIACSGHVGTYAKLKPRDKYKYIAMKLMKMDRLPKEVIFDDQGKRIIRSTPLQIREFKLVLGYRFRAIYEKK